MAIAERDAAAPVISLEHVCKTYPNGTEALQDIDLTVADGEFLFLVGPSGAGKSTIVRLIVREEKATRGKVFVQGRDLGRLPRHQLPHLRRQVGLVFQDFKLLPRLTTWENVAFALRVQGERGRMIRTRVTDALETVGLSHKARKYPHELSGGEQQRVGIARALVHSPSLLVADEPTGNIDPATAWELMQLLLRINAAGSTVVMATHNRDIVDVLRRRVVAIDRGRIVRDAPMGMYHEELKAYAVRA
jgi:cell division transport system ATP-binding protein